MNEELHYYVNFCGDFPPWEDIEQPSGKELADVLVECLPTHGIVVTQCEGIDFSHYLDCVVGESTIELMVGAEYLVGYGNRWYIMPCQKETFFGRSKVKDEDCRTLLLAINAVLNDCVKISDVCWYPEFDTPDYLALMPRADSPIRAADYEANLHPLIRWSWRLNHSRGGMFRPVFIVVCVIVACLISVVAPNGAGFIGALFVGALVLLFVGDFILSILVGRAAGQRLDKAAIVARARRKITGFGGRPRDR